MARYIYAPAQTSNWYGSKIYRSVEFIGSQQKGRGNSISKGRRYLKKKLGCSGNAIRRAMRTEERIYKHDYTQFGLDVYYYHKDYSDKIIREIIQFVLQNASDNIKKKIFDTIPTDEQYLPLIYWHQLDCLEWVADSDYKRQGEEARILHNRFNNIG